jgi:hypothetical protein
VELFAITIARNAKAMTIVILILAFIRKYPFAGGAKLAVRTTAQVRAPVIDEVNG